MRSKQKAKKANTNIIKIWTILFFFISIAFFGMVAYLNMLTNVQLVCIGGVVLAFVSVIFLLLLTGKPSKGRKITGVILSLLITIGYLLGIYYIANTMLFLSNITDVKEQTTEYYVLVNADSKYKELKDIEGQSVSISNENTTTQTKAEEKLTEEVNVDFVIEDSIMKMAEDVIGDDKIILVGKGIYENIKGVIDNFEAKTRILYKICIKEEQKDISKNVDVTKDSYNIYITGIDVSGPISTVSRSDVNMILTVNPKKHKILLTSIPRDSYVPLQGEGREGQLDKFTHTGIYGVDETILTAENLLDIDINYYVKVNFTTVRELVDILGGIEVESMYDFTAGGYHYDVGINHMDGEKALAFARERYSFSDGDFQRNRNQQLVVEGILKKATSSTTILKNYTNILETIENYMATNMKTSDIQKIVKMQLEDMSTWEIEKQGIQGSTGGSPCYSLGNLNASVVYPDKESVKEVSKKIKEYM